MSFDLTTLGEYAAIQGGFAYKSQDFIAEPGVPVLKIKNIRQGFVEYSNPSYVSEQVARSTVKWFTTPGDVLISMTGSGPSAPDSLVGRVARVWEHEPRALINQRIGRLRLREECEIDQDFLFYLLCQKQIQDLLVTNSTGSANQVNISSKTIEAIPCPRIDFIESSEVADFLNTFERRIRLLRETNATLEAIAQALFKSWFVDFDPVRAKMEGRAPEGMIDATAALFPDGFKESALGLVPRGWRVGKLVDLANLNPESWTARNQPARIAYIDLANTKDNEITSVTNYVFDEAPSRARRVLRTGDTIVGTVRPGNRSFAFIHEPTENLTGSTGFAVLRPSAVESTEFVFLAATQDASIEHLSHVADGGAYPAVRPDVVAGLQCVIPDTSAMNAFHAVVEPLLVNVSENQKQAQTLATLRDTLLPRLISGALRLPHSEEIK